MMGWGWNGGGWSGAGGWGFASGILSFVFLAAVVVGVVLLVRALVLSPSWHRDWGRSAPPAPPIVGHGHEKSSPLQLLEERYARGEIEREEFIQRRRDLQS